MRRSSLSASPPFSSPLPATRRRLSPLPRAAAPSLPARVYPKGEGRERGLRSAKKSKKVTLIPPACFRTLRPSTSRPRRFQRLPFSPYTSHFQLFTFYFSLLTFHLSLSLELIFHLFSNIKSPLTNFQPGINCSSFVPRNNYLFFIHQSAIINHQSSIINQQSAIINQKSTILPSPLRSSFVPRNE
jgi:hypothetical protein